MLTQPLSYAHRAARRVRDRDLAVLPPVPAPLRRCWHMRLCQPPNSFVNPVFACDVSQVPQHYLPCRRHNLDGTPLDPQSLSLCSEHDMPFADASQRPIYFGNVKYYERQTVLQSSQPPPGVHHHQVAQQQQVQVQMTQVPQRMPMQAPMQVPQRMPMQAPQRMPMQAPMQAPIAPHHVPVAQAMPMQYSHPLTLSQRDQELMPLPAGWEEKWTNEGQPYYVNHTTRSTQWTRPAYRPPQMPQRPNLAGMRQPSQHVFLPPGWEMKHAPDGRPYYIDHNTKRTLWQLPG